MSSQPIEILQNIFGYHSFKGLQEQIINHVISGESCLVLMPTGGGKSLCFQIPALVFEGITLVISPLIALMEDQVDTLHEVGISATYISSTIEFNDQQQIFQDIRNYKYKLVYITPERFSNIWFINFIRKLNISLLAIDEAHCISHWGHDFRPEYQKIAQTIKLIPQVPRIALTATADYYTKIDILHFLALKDKPIFSTSFNRGNLFYIAQEKNNAKKQLVDFINSHKNECGIVYCNSRKRVDDITQLLRESGFSVNSYHAGLDKVDRSLQQKQFIKLAEHEIIIREKGNLLIELLLIEKVNSVKSKKEIRKSERLVSNELNSFIEEFRDKWKGLKPGSMGSLSTCKEKMRRWMQENPTYSPQQILKAADIYINSLNSLTYLQQADYFIYKKDGKEESSRLSAFIDEIDTKVNDNWTSTLK